MNYRTLKFEDLKGKTITNISGYKQYSEEVIFETSDDDTYYLLSAADCCATCSLEDVSGDINDIIDSPIILAELVTNKETDPKDANSDFVEKNNQGSFTWSFYKLSTIKGSVTLRFYGSSNGCYSEDMSFNKLINGVVLGYETI